MALGEFAQSGSEIEATINVLSSIIEACEDQSLLNCHIETNSRELIKLGGDKGCHWKQASLRQMLKQALTNTNGELQYTHRECNAVASYLAEKASVLRASFGMTDSYRDKQLHALLILDMVQEGGNRKDLNAATNIWQQNQSHYIPSISSTVGIINEPISKDTKSKGHNIKWLVKCTHLECPIDDTRKKLKTILCCSLNGAKISPLYSNKCLLHMDNGLLLLDCSSSEDLIHLAIINY